MNKLLRLLATAALLGGFFTPANAQGVGQLAPGQVWGNPGVSSGPAVPMRLSYVPVTPSGDATGATDFANISAAQTLATSIGACVRPESGQWYLNSTVVLSGANQCIDGTGNSWNKNTFAGTGTSFNCLANAPCFKVSTTSDVTQNWRIANLSIHTPGSGTSATGITFDGATYGHLQNVFIDVEGASQIGMLARASSVTTNNVAFNQFDQLTIGLGGNAGTATNTVGIKLTSDASGPDTCCNTFRDTTIIGSLASHTLLWLAASDTNTFINLEEYGNATAAMTAIKFDYSVVADWPATTRFYGLEDGYNITSGASAIVNVGSPNGFALAHPNEIYGFGTGNGQTIPDLPTVSVIGYYSKLSLLKIFPSTGNNAEVLLEESGASNTWHVMGAGGGGFKIYDEATNTISIGIAATTDAVTIPNGGIASGTATPEGNGTINASGAYYQANTIGVTCSGSPTSSFASSLGIVTHC